MYEIESNIPVPRPARSRARTGYKWAEMRVGDSFFVAVERESGDTPEVIRKRLRQRGSQITASASAYRKARGLTDFFIQCRKAEPKLCPDVSYPDKYGVRVWCTETPGHAGRPPQS